MHHPNFLFKRTEERYYGCAAKQHTQLITYCKISCRLSEFHSLKLTASNATFTAVFPFGFHRAQFW